MSEAVVEKATRVVDYVDADVLPALPASFPCAWVAEESCRRVAEAADALDPRARESLLVRAAAFADDVLSILRVDVLPEQIDRCLFVDPDGRLHLIGTRNGSKVRVDEDYRIALIRSKPIALAGPRAGTLRQEARDLLCFPLASADRKPVQAVQALDLEPVGEKGMFFLDLDAPTGSAYLAGRCDRLRIFGDGKVLILCFRPLPNVDAEGYQVGNPDGDLAKLRGSVSRRRAEIAAAEGVEPPARTARATDGGDLGADLAESGDGAGAGQTGGADGGGMPPSDSPFDQPGWAASVAPVLEQ